VILTLYRQLNSIAEKEFDDIVIESEIIFSHSGRARKLRLNLIDGTFIDIWYSEKGEYSFHWEQRGVRDVIYRHDNAPHLKWVSVKTYPKHCHDSVDENVSESYISNDPEEALREFMAIVRKKLFELRIQ
jgi:hypothetical protein